MKRLLCLLLACAALLALCGCARAREEAGTVTLWCASDDPLLPALREEAAAYNQSRKSGAPSVALREFDDDARLAAALNTALPDLLLCSHTLAFPLDERGLLTDAGSEAAYPEALAARCAGIGRRVFPIGSRVQLLVTRGADAPADLFTLCGRAAASAAEAKRPVLAADSYADLICQAVLGGGEFHADRTRDCFNADFRAAWNALAEAAFSGGLYTGDALPAGSLPAQYVYSDRLRAGVPEGCTLSLPPLGGKPRLADLRCLAVTAREGRQARGAGAFISWLFSGSRPAGLALQSGLIPALPGGEDTDALRALLLRAREETLWLPDGGSDYCRNRSDFEAAFRAAVDLLK